MLASAIRLTLGISALFGWYVRRTFVDYSNVVHKQQDVVVEAQDKEAV